MPFVTEVKIPAPVDATKVTHLRSEFVQRPVTVITYKVTQPIYSDAATIRRTEGGDPCGSILVTELMPLRLDPTY